MQFKRAIKKIALISPKTPLQRENPEIYNMFQRNRDRIKTLACAPIEFIDHWLL